MEAANVVKIFELDLKPVRRISTPDFTMLWKILDTIQGKDLSEPCQTSKMERFGETINDF